MSDQRDTGVLGDNECPVDHTSQKIHQMEDKNVRIHPIFRTLLC